MEDVTMIDFKQMLKEKDISILTASKIMNIPYASLYAIVNGNVCLEDCKFSTIIKLSAFFDIQLNDLILPNENFETFRNELHHALVKSDTCCYESLKDGELVERYFLHKEYTRALYLIALMDYLERKYNMSRSDVVNKYYNLKLSKPFDIRSSLCKTSDFIPEFYARNIYEGELYDSV